MQEGGLGSQGVDSPRPTGAIRNLRQQASPPAAPDGQLDPEHHMDAVGIGDRLHETRRTRTEDRENRQPPPNAPLARARACPKGTGHPGPREKEREHLHRPLVTDVFGVVGLP